LNAGAHRVKELEALLQTEPENAPALRELAIQYKAEGQLRKAGRRLLQLLTLHPQDKVGLKLRSEFEMLKKSGSELK
jgi:hypothetical protein